jgi:hypothetical protein
VAAYQRKKERADDLLETLVELQRRYDEVLQEKEAGMGASEATRCDRHPVHAMPGDHNTRLLAVNAGN